MLVDRDGRFRVGATSKRFHDRIVRATQEWAPRPTPTVTDYRGSRRFLVDQAGGLPLRIVHV
jgi:hypothetical protein